MGHSFSYFALSGVAPQRHVVEAQCNLSTQPLRLRSDEVHILTPLSMT